MVGHEDIDAPRDGHGDLSHARRARVDRDDDGDAEFLFERLQP